MDYGFCGIFARHDDPGAALTLASKAVVKATGCSDEDIRTFLESIQGRYFAAGVSKLLSENALSTAAAVDVVVARWMHLKILTGFVCHCELKGGHGQRLAAPYQLFCVEESSGSQSPLTPRPAGTWGGRRVKPGAIRCVNFGA